MLETIHNDLKTFLTAKVDELTALHVHQTISKEIHNIVKEEVKSYLSRFMFVIAQPNDKV